MVLFGMVQRIYALTMPLMHGGLPRPPVSLTELNLHDDWSRQGVFGKINLAESGSEGDGNISYF